MRTLTLQAALTRKYGTVDITFSLSETVTVETGLQRQEAFDNLVDQLNDQHEHYAAEYLHKALPPVDDSQYKQAGFGTEQHEVIKLTRKIDEGKVLYRVFAGKWTKYGAIIYPEIADKYRLADMFGADDWSVVCDNLYVTIDTTGKSPKAVHFAKA